MTQRRCIATFWRRATKDCGTSDTKDLDDDFERIQKLGYTIGQSGEVGGPDGRMVYFATQAHPGTVIELSEISGPKGKIFEMIAEKSRTWDGSDPIRRI